MSIMITSLTNSKVKYVRRLQRDRRFRHREKMMVVEGSRWLSELLASQLAPQQLFYTADWQAANADILQQLTELAHLPPLPVSPAVMAAMSDTTTPPGIMAILPQPNLPLPGQPSLLLILDGINTPGNLGTMLRTAAAAGADGVLLGPGCVDASNPKVVRGSMGALLRLPVLSLSWAKIGEIVQNIAVWVAVVNGGKGYTAVPWQNPSALIIGSEAAGVSPQAQQIASGSLTIPMYAATESLNAAIAAGIILFEARRQRSSRAA
ncbi:MAG: RNA methyltransferase [Chloroflexi bacterium]|nr:RNA methyltransferase [Chloroflexota bacterium]